MEPYTRNGSIIGKTMDYGATGFYQANVGFVLADAVYDSVSFSVSAQDTTPTDIAFNPDGTKMYLAGLGSNRVYQYSLSVGFDISTASYDSVSFAVAAQPYGVKFNPDGTKMFVLGFTATTVFEYSLSTGFDLSTASFSGNSFSVSAQDAAPRGITFNTNGTKMYMVGTNSDTAYQYSLSVGFDISTASYDSVSFFFTQDSVPYGVTFNPDGTKMFMMGVASDTVYQYSLSTGFDLTTVSYDSVSFSVAAQDTNPLRVNFNTDGTKMYIVGNINDRIYQYSTVGLINLNKKNSGIWDLQAVLESNSQPNVEPGQQAYTTPGTYNFIVPAGVTQISAVCVGGGGASAGSGSNRSGGAGGGGGLAYGTFAVTPGETLTVVVGAGGSGGVSTTSGTDGGNSRISRSTTDLLVGGGGKKGLASGLSGTAQAGTGGAGGTSSGTERAGGGTGGAGGLAAYNAAAGAGGGAAGYSGNGGNGGAGANATTTGTSGSGGGGGGGGSSTNGASGGGGVGILGEGSNGAGGTATTGGRGGSGGTDGEPDSASGGIAGGANGGLYGGGGASNEDDTTANGGNGGQGAVRIIWGAGRSYPSTGTADV